jgi:fructose-bisphosphate aldolase class I
VEIYGINRETRKQGHDNVANRCQKYYDVGARFAKWRAVLKTGITEPSEFAV